MTTPSAPIGLQGSHGEGATLASAAIDLIDIFDAVDIPIVAICRALRSRSSIRRRRMRLALRHRIWA